MSKKTIFRTICKTGLLAALLLAPVLLYPRQHDVFVDSSNIYSFPFHNFFTSGLTISMLFAVCVMTYYEVVINVKNTHSGVVRPIVSKRIVILQVLCANLSVVMLLVLFGLAIQMKSLYTIYWNLARIFLLTCFVFALANVLLEMYVVSPWSFMWRFYVGMIGCVTGLNLYWRATIDFVPLYAIDLTFEYMQPIYVAALVTFAVWLHRAPEKKVDGDIPMHTS